MGGSAWSCYDASAAMGQTESQFDNRNTGFSKVSPTALDEISVGVGSEHKLSKTVPRVLLLGTSLGGKTTLFKQFIEYYSARLSESSTDRFKDVQTIRENVVNGLKETVEVARILEVGNNDG
jgi:GTPase SAR1 family protein